jgi:glycosyltransferase involved in cell wall biosynthesis
VKKLSEGQGKTVTVCICTYRRPEQLRRLLSALSKQDTRGRFSYSIVVADNDRGESARSVVRESAATASVPVMYRVEPDQNIARARNCALEGAAGDYVAFIDDDEFPASDWLARMIEACEAFRAGGVLGPVRPFFDETPPAWLVRSRLCERPEYPTGTALHWRQTRTGNALVRRTILDGIPVPFRPEFGSGGEDQDFFRRLMECGHRFVWCNEAPVYETVPRERRRRRYFLKRALLRGQNERLLLNAPSVMKSLVALPVYCVRLPVTCLIGQHALMDCSVRLLDHVGRLCAAMGIRLVRGKYLSS